MHFVWYFQVCLSLCHCFCLVSQCTVCALMFYVYFICFDFIYIFYLLFTVSFIYVLCLHVIVIPYSHTNLTEIFTMYSRLYLQTLLTSY